MHKPKSDRGLRRTATAALAAVAMLLPAWNAAARHEDLTDDTSYICIVPETGLVLMEQKADVARAPASMVKMMQMLMVAEGLDAGTWTLDTPITASKHAEAMGGTQVFLKEGETRRLGDVMLAVAVGSANDAAMAVAEALWGSEEKYLKAMNKRAKELGMLDSEFHSVHGLPPDRGEKPDRTSARDMALLGRACLQLPAVMSWVGHKEYRFRPQDSNLQNTNKLLWQMAGCDGIKTGYTRAAGFCLTATAERDGIRLLAVVMGCKNRTGRFRAAKELLEDGFKEVQRVKLLEKGQVVADAVPVHNATEPAAHLQVAADAWGILRTKDLENAEVVVEQPKRIYAPVSAGTNVGHARVRLQGKTLCEVPLCIPKDIPTPGWRWKLSRTTAPAPETTQSVF